MFLIASYTRTSSYLFCRNMNSNYSYPNTYSYPAMNNNVPNPGYNQAPPPGIYNPYQQPFYPHPTNQNGASNPPVYHFPTDAQNNQQQTHNQTYNAPPPQNPPPNHSAQNNAPAAVQNPPQITQNHQQPSGNILNGQNAVPLNQRVIPPPKYYKSNKGKPSRDAPYRRPDPATKKADPKKVPAPGVKKLLTEVLSEINTLSDALNKHAAEFSRFFQFIVKQAQIGEQEDEKERQARKAEDGKEKQAKKAEEGEKQPEPAEED